MKIKIFGFSGDGSLGHGPGRRFTCLPGGLACLPDDTDGEAEKEKKRIQGIYGASCLTAIKPEVLKKVLDRLGCTSEEVHRKPPQVVVDAVQATAAAMRADSGLPTGATTPAPRGRPSGDLSEG